MLIWLLLFEIFRCIGSSPSLNFPAITLFRISHKHFQVKNILAELIRLTKNHPKRSIYIMAINHLNTLAQYHTNYMFKVSPRKHPFLLRSSPLGTFREEERRSSSRNVPSGEERRRNGCFRRLVQSRIIKRADPGITHVLFTMKLNTSKPFKRAIIILRESEAKSEMKNYNPPSFFVWR